MNPLGKHREIATRVFYRESRKDNLGGVNYYPRPMSEKLLLSVITGGGKKHELQDVVS